MSMINIDIVNPDWPRPLKLGFEKHVAKEDTFKKVYLSQWSRQGINVFGVDGNYVRLNFDVDFTEGGHDKVYDFIPEGEIWLDDANEGEWPFIFLHELTERNRMCLGWDYDSAHDYASEWELIARDSPDETDKLIDEQFTKVPITQPRYINAPQRVGPPAGVEISPEDRITQAIEKAWEQVGKVKVQKTIQRGGKAFTQTFWVTPQQAQELGLKPIEQPKPTYEPKHGVGRPTTAEHVMDLPHVVYESKPAKIGDKRFGPTGWQEMSYEDKVKGLSESQKERIIASIDTGQSALAEMYEGKPGLHIEAKHNVQGVLSYEKRANELHVDFLSSAPWNYPKSEDPRRVVGVGSRLLAELFEKALIDPDIKKVSLWANEDAKPFYRKVGFTQTGPKAGMEIDRESVQKFLKRLEQ